MFSPILAVNFMTSVLNSAQSIGQILIGFIVVLIPLVVIHEFGHLLVARLFKVRVVEYGVGIPPRTRIFKVWKGIVWSLNWLPLGGFAKIYGDHDAIDVAQDEYTRDKKLAGDNYEVARTHEVFAGHEIQYVLGQNNIVYDKEWESYEKNVVSGAINSTQALELYKNDKWNLKKSLNNLSEDRAKAMTKQLLTLISWEMTAKLKSKEVFFNRNVFVKTAILLGGVLFNFITAWVLFSIILSFNSLRAGVSSDAEEARYRKDYNVLSIEKDITIGVLDGSAAYNAGLRNNDKLISFNSKRLNDYKDNATFVDAVQAIGDREVEVVYKRGEENITTKLKPEKKDGRYIVGIRTGDTFESVITYKSNNVFAAIPQGYTESVNLSGKVTESIGKLLVSLGNSIVSTFQGKATAPKDSATLNQVSGPIGIGGISFAVIGADGVWGALYLMAVISIGLAVSNLLPLPALDGGRIILAVIAAVTGKRNRIIEGRIISGTMLVLILLMLVIAFKDVRMLF
jgi:membrane-associated protease RseP (regulator of RpoE activity)